MELDTGPLDPGGELRTDLPRQLRSDLTAEEARELLGFDPQHALAIKLLIPWLERLGGTECEVGGVFDLHQAPVVSLPEHLADWATLFGLMIKDAVHPVGRKRVGEFPSTVPIIAPCEHIVGHDLADACCRQLPRQPVVAVTVELQVERTRCRRACQKFYVRGIIDAKEAYYTSTLREPEKNSLPSGPDAILLAA